MSAYVYLNSIVRGIGKTYKNGSIFPNCYNPKFLEEFSLLYSRSCLKNKIAYSSTSQHIIFILFISHKYYMEITISNLESHLQKTKMITIKRYLLNKNTS